MASEKQQKSASDSPKPGKSSDVLTEATPDSSGPSKMTQSLGKELQAPLPEKLKQCKTNEDLCKYIQKGRNYNDFIENFNSCVGNGDTIRREKYPPTIYGIVVNDTILVGDKWRFVKIGFTQIDTTKGTNNRMETVIKQIKGNEYTQIDVLFKLPIRAVDTTPFLDTEERIRKQFGFLVDKILAKKLNLPVKTEWVLVSQEYITNYKKIETSNKDTKSTSLFSDYQDLKFVQGLKKTSKVRNAQEIENWLKEEKQFPEWLGLRDKDDTFEVYQKGTLPVDLDQKIRRLKSM